MFSIGVWLLLVTAGIYDAAVRPQQLRFLAGLGIVVGVMCIFHEVNCLMREPE